MPEQQDNKHCTWTHEPGHPKAGQRCEGYRVSDSAFCVSHGENLQKSIEKRTRAVQRKKEILEEFDFNYHELKSVEQVKALLEKLANGVLTGTIKPEKARAVHEILRTALKTLQDKGPATGSRATLKISLDGEAMASLIDRLPPELLDAFLVSGAEDSVKMIEDYQAHGESIAQVIDVTPKETVDLFGGLDGD